MARNTPNFGLKVWDQLTDLFNHTDLAANWDKLDAHDHTTGKGLSINTAALVNSSITTPKIADANVTTAKILDSNVTSSKLAASSITPAKLAAMPGFRVYLPANVATTSGSNQLINTWRKSFDNDGILGGLTVGITNFTVNTSGYYLVHVQVNWAASATGNRIFFIESTTIDGVLGYNPIFFQSTSASATNIYHQASGMIYLGAGSVFRFQANQNSGGALNILGDPVNPIRSQGESTFMNMYYLGP